MVCGSLAAVEAALELLPKLLVSRGGRVVAAANVFSDRQGPRGGVCGSGSEKNKGVFSDHVHKGSPYV